MPIVKLIVYMTKKCSTTIIGLGTDKAEPIVRGEREMIVNRKHS
jgi:hypothetical protein